MIRNLRWLQKFGCECWYCGSTLVPEEATVDHRVPRCRGGSDRPSNRVPACRRCNSMKRDKTEAEFYVYKPCFRRRQRRYPRIGRITRWGRPRSKKRGWERDDCFSERVCSRQFRDAGQGRAAVPKKIRAEELLQLLSGMLGRAANCRGDTEIRQESIEVVQLHGRQGEI